ncbi:glycosyltransferase family 2 protein [uncultured Bacteroides sp.]|uniref:glycosyltransferase family 2 protein n=1 Tax=uncultured Bacteroides sp. TaxID=162156 RepID=UPI00260C8785|nr:glycosyltransferase family 2 protein [uncultured Bacteroides sp.]
MDNNIKVSVIIPFYNRVDWLEEAVISVLNQSYNNIEIIVVNDGSYEDLSGFLSIYGDKIFYVYKQNEGPGAARNRGIEIATGDFIAFLDSDDIWEPDKTEKQLHYMLANNYVWSHTGGMYFQDGCILRQKPFDFHNNSAWVARRSLVSMQIATPSVMIRADILKQNKNLRFNVTMRYSQDTFFYQLMAQYYELGYLNEKMVLIRLRDSAKEIHKKNANKRYRIRFSGRKILFDFIKSIDNDVINSVPLYVQLLLKQYALGNSFFCYLEHKNYSAYFIELLAKILFAYLFVLGRIYIYINDYIYNMESVDSITKD